MQSNWILISFVVPMTSFNVPRMSLKKSTLMSVENLASPSRAAGSNFEFCSTGSFSILKYSAKSNFKVSVELCERS